MYRQIFKARLNRTLLIAMLLVSSVVTLLTTSLLLYAEYLEHRATIAQTLEESALTHAESITNALWTFNEGAVRLQLEGILRDRDIAYAQLLDPDGRTISAFGRLPEGEVGRMVMPLVFDYRDEPQLLGKLILTADLSDIIEHLWHTLGFILAGQGVMVFVTSIVLLLLFHQLVTRHLYRLTQQTRTWEVDSPAPIAIERSTHRWSEGDELSQLTEAINQAYGRVASTYRDLNRSRSDLAASMVELEAIYSASPDMVFIHNPDGSFCSVNQHVLDNYGYSRAQILALSIPDLSAPGFTEEMALTYIHQAMAGGEPDFEWLARRADGSQFPIEVRLRRLEPLATGEGTPLIAIVRDISSQKQAEHVLKEQQHNLESRISEEQALSLVLRTSLEPIPMEAFLQHSLEFLLSSVDWLRTAPSGAIYLQDKERGKLLRLASHNLQETPCADCHTIDVGKCVCGVAANVGTAHYGFSSGVVRMSPSQAFTAPHSYTIPIMEKEQVLGVLLLQTIDNLPFNEHQQRFLRRIGRVLSTGVIRRHNEAAIEHQAYHDHLTGLPNRLLLNDRLTHELTLHRRSTHHGAVLFIDLDHFKTINDSLGHSSGDQLLCQVVARLESRLRKGDTLARLGGDEFVVLLTLLPAAPDQAISQAQLVASELGKAMNQPFTIDGHLLQVTLSIGIALYADEIQSAEDLLKHADIAMYRAKSDGRNTARFYDPSMQQQVDRRLSLQGELRYALQHDEFLLYCQPQVDRAGTIVGAEVLIRWQKADGTIVSPGEFIDVAEETGLIVDIGHWVLRKSCETFRRWHEQLQLDDRFYLSVNVSPKQFAEHDFVERVERLIDLNGSSTSHLMLELTEGILVNDVKDVTTKMRRLKSHGILFSVDDFGTGYSSLSYLSQFPLDELKIDQSFVRGLPEDESSAVIVKTIIAMATQLNFELVAEGVETKEQLQFLAGVTEMKYQGYYFHRPIPIAEFERLLAGGEKSNLLSFTPHAVTRV